LEKILFNLSAYDLVSLGSTCRYFHGLSLSQAVWKKLYLKLTWPDSTMNEGSDWRRLTILKMSQRLVLQQLGTASGSARFTSHHFRRQQWTMTQTFNTPMAQGLRRVEPILDHTLLLDNEGTIFTLFTPRRNMPWRRSLGYSVLCNNVKDFAVDPRSDLRCRKYIYVLGRQELSDSPTGRTTPVMSDYVEIVQSETLQKIFRITFHPSQNFTQLHLCGPENRRTVLLLSDIGEVYSMCLNEIYLSNPLEHIVLTLRTISQELPELPVAQIYTSHNYIVYVTADGSVFTEVHSLGTYRQLFGTWAGYDASSPETIYPVMLPYKVVKCSVGPTHFCLVDDRGRVFMQGNNRYGQLGTGDKIDRDKPTMVVPLSMAAVDVWCGLNHTLALLQSESGDKQVHGCGCGSGGRLPGYWEGSPVFVRLNIHVPCTATSLCSSRECLYLLCCHDIAEAPAPCYVPPTNEEDIERGQAEEKERLDFLLTQMTRCSSSERLINMLQSTVKQHLTGLSAVHKAFLHSALRLILDRHTSVEPQPPSNA
ncbi:hypothetical protein NFI96_031529, partial [Prochilodus magdalenae]